MKNKLYFILLLLILIIILIMSCKKVNLLGPNNIPPPTAFPNIDDEKPEIPDYPDPTPVPTPPDEGDIEEKPIEVKPEVVPDGIVFGGYGRRFKFKNEWYVLATNEYEYKPETKTLNPTGKAAILKLENDGSTITKIYDIDLGNLEETECWKHLNSKKLIIEANRLRISVGAKGKGSYTVTEYYFPDCNFQDVDSWRLVTGKDYIVYYKNRESSDLINWIDSADTMGKTYYLPDTNFNEPTIQGRLGTESIAAYNVIYINGKLLAKFDRTFIDENPTGFRDPSAGNFSTCNREYYIVDINKDTSDNKNWVTNEFPFKEKRNYVNFYLGNNKLYIGRGWEYHFEYGDYEKYDGTIIRDCWYNVTDANYSDKNGIWSTEDGINWKEEKNVNLSQLKRFRTDELHDTVGNYEAPNGTPLEPSYTELNGKYYRTFNITYPMPPIKEIMETVDRLETNFIVTEEHIKKSGYYQLQVSSVPPDKAQESDWVNVVPNNELASSIGWESGGADLFTFNNKIVRLVDYDRQFKLNTQYETALNLSHKYYALLEASKTMEDYKKYDYYFLYYKAMAEMLKMIKDKGNDYFRPDEAVTHYTFELN